MEKIINYFKSAFAEIKKVSWPSRKETFQYTVLVIGLSLAVAAVLGGLDFVFNLIIQKLLNRQIL